MIFHGDDLIIQYIVWQVYGGLNFKPKVIELENNYID